MQAYYVIHGPHKGEDEVMLTAPLDPLDQAYLVDGIIPALRPLSDTDYLNGPAVILHTMAHYSYVLYGSDLYWCVEWEPGLIVLRCSPDGTLAWTALRSPVPDFGGRPTTKEELDAYDEDADNPQYNLVFEAWDAQFEEHPAFTPADAATEAAYHRALAHVERLGEQLAARFESDLDLNQWQERCMQNLSDWAGEGLRLPWD